MIYSIIEAPASTAAVLNNDLELKSQWKLSFNHETRKQAVEIIFSNRKTKTFHPFLFFNGIIVTNDHKHFGLILDSKLSFSKHVNDKINKSRKFIGVLKFLSSY